MGKLMNRLQQQLTTEHKQDAEECIKVYDYLKETSGGKVWSSQWTPLTNTTFMEYPKRRYSLSNMGKMFLKGIGK